MTMWNPSLGADTEPKYQVLLDALRRDIESGTLPPGTRLPTQRELARRLGVAIGTVGRAYAVAEQRGIVSGEVGRGTFVRGPEPGVEEGALETEDPELIDLSKSRLIRDPRVGSAADLLQAIARRPDLDRLMDFYQPAPGMARHRETGARWLQRTGLAVPAERVIITGGAQHGAATVLASLARPGDLVLTEHVTYTGMKAIASLLHLQLRGLPLDGHGLVPEAFEVACREGAPRALYCMPTLQNPTARTMPLERRQAIAEIAAKYDVALIEDDVYGFLAEQPLPPLTAIAPAHSYYITSTSKSMAPGLRVGYVVAPESRVDRVAGVIRASTWLIAPLLAELASEWIERGEADAMVTWKREETTARHAVALRILGGWLPVTPAPSFHLWLPLPEPWRTEEFVAQARSRQVVVSPSEEFVVGRESAPHAVRVSLGATASRARLEEGLRRLAELLRDGPEPSLTGY
ncbi:MAG TPA: PLP-dependent aminotransferase family protein [Gemmatimonadales bacterium]|nr:PLP-dependent aminotransferase family protein [Gemmatimonadales bacterium]